MSEHRPREIQLTSKQLVFVFMSTVLVAVVVFLLGVWVGRGIDTGVHGRHRGRRERRRAEVPGRRIHPRRPLRGQENP